jgi:hypothetical protein
MIESLPGKGLLNTISQAVGKARNTETSTPNILSKAQNKLADQVSISDETLQNLESLKNLDKQLTRFLDVLKGRRSAGSVLNQLDREQGGFVAGAQARSALSIQQIKSIRETTAFSAGINSEGELDLVLTKTRDTLTQTSLSLSTQQSSFLARL